ncbi:MAG: fucose isomerase [Spirochaetaceae bacterium]|nr:fucose isomerase [Spirochaetaceae bacterium]
MFKEKVTFGVIVGTRGFFNPKLAEDGRAEIVRRLESIGYGVLIPPKELTNVGSVESLSDARKYAEFFNARIDEVDGFIVTLPNFGDELGIVNTLAGIHKKLPVLIHAFDDELDKLGIENRRDAFCGKISVTCNLYQYDIPFTNTRQHTLAVGSKEFAGEIDRFARVCRVTNGLRSARVGAIGPRPAPFQTMRASEKLLQAGGITVVTVDQSEIFEAAGRRRDTDPDVVARSEELHAYGDIPKDMPEERILRHARLSVTLDEWITENEIDAAAIMCWTSVQNTFGCAFCASMSMMGDKKMIPAACETDIAGVVSMYALDLASGNPAALMDWNNNVGSDPNKVACSHCANFPKAFFGGDIEISNLDVLGSALGAERCFGAVKGRVMPGPLTFFRISTDDRRGTIKAYLGEGEFTDDEFGIDGGIGIAKIDNLQGLFNHICKNGFEHHGALVRSHCADIIQEAIDTYLGWELYHHE